MRLPRNIKAAIVHGQRSHSVAAMHPLSIGRIQLRGLVAEASNRYAGTGLGPRHRVGGQSPAARMAKTAYKRCRSALKV